MSPSKTKMFVAAIVFFCSFGVGRMTAQNLNVRSDCPQNSCSLDIGAIVPIRGHTQPPGPATASTDFSAVGQPWSFSLQTAPPVSWAYSDLGYWYEASFGQGGTFQMTGPIGTFTGIITSASVQGGEMPFFIFELSANFTGSWSNGLPGNGSVELLYQEDNGIVFESTLSVALGHSGGSRPDLKVLPH